VVGVGVRGSGSVGWTVWRTTQLTVPQPRLRTPLPPQLLAARNAEIESEIGAIVIRPSAAAAAPAAAAVGGSPRLQPQIDTAGGRDGGALPTIAASKALQRVMHECIAEFFAREGGSGGGSSGGAGALTSQERHDIRRAIIASLIDEETRRARLSGRELAELEATLAASLLDVMTTATAASSSSPGDGNGDGSGPAAREPPGARTTAQSPHAATASGSTTALVSSMRRLAGGIMRLRLGKRTAAVVAAVPLAQPMAAATPQLPPSPAAAVAPASGSQPASPPVVLGHAAAGACGITTTGDDGAATLPLSPQPSPHAVRRPLSATSTPSFTTSAFKPLPTAARKAALLPALSPLGEPLPPLASASDGVSGAGGSGGGTRSSTGSDGGGDNGGDECGVSPSALTAAEVATRAAHLRQQRDLLLAKKAAERQRALDEYQGRRRALAAQQQLQQAAGSGGGGAAAAARGARPTRCAPRLRGCKRN
jgi:hypothetical protein